MKTYKHSVSLDAEKCKGCTNCLKRCPTEAIRIREGKAVIEPTRCIDCGECIRVCPYKAKKAIYDKFSFSNKYKHFICLPAPSFYGQFDNLEDIDYIIDGLMEFGFDDVFEVAVAAELVTEYTRLYLKNHKQIRPLIGTACPVITRLISLRFPFLCDNFLPILPPIDIAAKLAKEKAIEHNPKLKEEDICTVFISPCPAKVSYVKNGFSEEKNYVDYVVSMSDMYFSLISIMKKDKLPKYNSKSGMIGLSWASTGGESSAIFNDRYLAADGIENVIKVLDEIENGNMPNLDFIELNACNSGCVGGALAVQNPYIAKA
ncbi:MAG: [Fe-Fe] hydrogenase large subunit C-terminal domain-containing protein, partial [Oscillospiraceae bacterium]